jgi:C_GCAxxG_C_C family probable redox protein
MMLRALEIQGKENPDVVRAMTGFAGGLGWTGDLCGVLTGAVAVLGLYAGKGSSADQDDVRLMFMVEDLLKWFKEGFGEKYGGIHCQEILGLNTGKIDMDRCIAMITETMQYVKELLVENGFELSGQVLDD